MERGGDSGGDGSEQCDDERGDGELEGVGIARGHQMGDGIVEADGVAEVDVEDSAPVAEILRAEGHIEAVGVAERGDVGGGAPSPSICWTGSPGTRWMRRKTRETTSQRTGEGVAEPREQGAEKRLH